MIRGQACFWIQHSIIVHHADIVPHPSWRVSEIRCDPATCLTGDGDVSPRPEPACLSHNLYGMPQVANARR